MRAAYTWADAIEPLAWARAADVELESSVEHCVALRAALLVDGVVGSRRMSPPADPRGLGSLTRTCAMEMDSPPCR